MGGERLRECQGQTLAPCVPQRGHRCEACFGLEPPGGDGLPQRQEVPLGVAHELEEHVAVASPAAAKAPHDLGDLLPSALRVAVEVGHPLATLLGALGDEFERFFGAFYSAVASVTR